MPLVCDMSSDILSRPVDVSKYGLIFAGAQKNLAPAGLTIVIIREDLAGQELPITPADDELQDHDRQGLHVQHPPLLVHLHAGSGAATGWSSRAAWPAWRRSTTKKAQMLYDVLDNAKLFTVSAEKGSRSHMNVTFRSASEELDAKFVAESVKAGFTNLKGHRSVGGMRASIYNAMPTEGVEKLCDFIQEFDKEN